MAGLNAAMGVLLALEHRHKTGRGQIVDSAIYEAVLGFTEALVAEYDAGGHTRERHGSALPGIAPSNAYPAADGKEVIIGANQDTVFARLCEVMGAPELVRDPRYIDHQSRGEHQEELDVRVADWTRTMPAQEIVDRLGEAGVPVGLAYTAADMLEDPHFKARGAIVRVADPERGSLAMQNVVPRLSDSPGRILGLGPALGADTENVLSGALKFDAARIAKLREQGII